MTRDQVFLVSFAKVLALLTYIMLHILLISMTAITLLEPPAWLLAITYTPASWTVMAFFVALITINFLFIPIAILLAMHDSMENQRRQILYYAARGVADRATTEEPLKFFDTLERNEDLR